MKKTVLITIITIILPIILISQDNKTNFIGINVSISSGEIYRFGGSIDGGYEFDGGVGFLVGLIYVMEIDENLYLCTGIDYSKNSFDYSFTNASGYHIKEKDPRHVDIISIPVNLKLMFKRKYYASSGLQFDQKINSTGSAPIDNQTGIGINFKIGKDIIIGNNSVLSIAPEIIIHAIIPFNPEKNQQRLTEFGLRIGYRLGV